MVYCCKTIRLCFLIDDRVSGNHHEPRYAKFRALQFLPLSVTLFDSELYFKALSRTVDFANVYVFSLLKEPEV